MHKYCQLNFITCVAINDVQTALTMAWDYHEVWRSIGVELNIDKSMLDSIEKSHSGHHDCLRALIEVWLAGGRLTDVAREAMTNALQSVRVAIAIAGTIIVNLCTICCTR